MFKFDNSHIFTGYLKQLLSSVNLPTCRIYTREFAEYMEQHGKEDPRVIESFDTIVYTNSRLSKQRIAARVNYLKGNELYNYFWNYSQNSPELGHNNLYWRRAANVFYDSSKNIPGLTKVLNSPGNIYDAVTHEHLGEYLRFMRDYHSINLMPLYNCFNNKIYNNIYHKINISKNSTKTIQAIFDSQDNNYRIYAFPVKLFADYTIAIDCNKELEMFCGLYTTSLDTSSIGADLMARTYQKINRPYFNKPFLYDKLNVKYWNYAQEGAIAENAYPLFINKKSITRWDIVNREQDLKLFIKIPTSCKSSITVLEGDFRNFNDVRYAPVQHKADTGTSTGRVVWEYTQNHAVINFGDTRDKQNGLDANESPFIPIGKLQLLALNTEESYPFADRLVEYLVGSAITPIDEIPDNIKRAQKVMSNNNHHFKIEGIWEDQMQKIIYDYLMNSGPIEVDNSLSKARLIDRRRGYHPRVGHASKSTLYDVLGYIDKDAEKWYASWKIGENNKAAMHDNIQNVDIYTNEKTGKSLWDF